jgi:hypothetical protein
MAWQVVLRKRSSSPLQSYYYRKPTTDEEERKVKKDQTMQLKKDESAHYDEQLQHYYRRRSHSRSPKVSSHRQSPRRRSRSHKRSRSPHSKRSGQRSRSRSRRRSTYHTGHATSSTKQDTQTRTNRPRSRSRVRVKQQPQSTSQKYTNSSSSSSSSSLSPSLSTTSKAKAKSSTIDIAQSRHVKSSPSSSIVPKSTTSLLKNFSPPAIVSGVSKTMLMEQSAPKSYFPRQTTKDLVEEKLRKVSQEHKKSNSEQSLKITINQSKRDTVSSRATVQTVQTVQPINNIQSGPPARSVSTSSPHSSSVQIMSFADDQVDVDRSNINANKIQEGMRRYHSMSPTTTARDIPTVTRSPMPPMSQIPEIASSSPSPVTQMVVPPVLYVPELQATIHLPAMSMSPVPSSAVISPRPTNTIPPLSRDPNLMAAGCSYSAPATGSVVDGNMDGLGSMKRSCHRQCLHVAIYCLSCSVDDTCMECKCLPIPSLKELNHKKFLSKSQFNSTLKFQRVTPLVQITAYGHSNDFHLLVRDNSLICIIILNCLYLVFVACL